MKECPKCHAQYDDSMNFCINDGCQLSGVAGTDANDGIDSRTSSGGKRKVKRGGCLKKVVVACVVVIVALGAFYNYIMNAATYLRVEPEQVDVIKAGGVCKVGIDYDGYVWTINHRPDWVSIDENDNDFVLRVGPNRSGQNREGSVTVQSGRQLAHVSIRQMGMATVMRASENRLAFSMSGGRKKLVIETDGCEWEARFPDWIEVSDGGDGTIVVKCNRNKGEYRTGTVTIGEDNVSTSIYVTQGGTCGNCHGKGEMSCSACFGAGSTGFGMFYSPCMWCGGSGKIKCNVCNGTGEIVVSE